MQSVLSTVRDMFFFYIEFEVVNVVAVVTYKPFYFFQEQFYMFTSRHTMLILSLSRLQKLHKTSCATPISFNTILVAKILCNNLIWNHFSFTSCSFPVLLKQAFQSILSHNFVSLLLQQFVPFSISTS